MVNIQKFLLLLLVPFCMNVYSQDMKPIDTIYNPLVKSIYFRQNGEIVIHPIFFVDREKSTLLEFDLIEGSPRNLHYSLYHYDRYWNPSEIEFGEAIQGFEEQEITNFRTSKQTLVPYVHYSLYLPDQQWSFRITGNYLLVVYDREGGLLFTRRLFVTSNSFGIEAKFISPTSAELFRSHIAIDFALKTNQFKIINPVKELSVQIIQNEDFNTRKVLGEPSFFSPNNIHYKSIDGIVFGGMKEYRRKDIRTTVHLTQDIDYWDERDGNFHCWLEHDIVRAHKPYYTETDINGRYICISNDVPEDEVRSDYVMAHFTLNSNTEYEEPIYIYGALTDYQCKEEFRMNYDAVKRAYLGQVLLKNGFYNFMYATKDSDGLISTESMEGNWYETENEYMILCYYRPHGGRYDQLVLASVLNSNR